MHVLSNYITHFRQTHTHMHTQSTVQLFFPFLLIWHVVQCLKSAKINNPQVIRKATFVFLLHTWKCIGKLISSHSSPPNLGDVRSVNPGGSWQHLSTLCLIMLIAREWDDIRLIMLPQICGSNLWLFAESVPYASVWNIVFVFPSGITDPLRILLHFTSFRCSHGSPLFMFLLLHYCRLTFTSTQNLAQFLTLDVKC